MISQRWVAFGCLCFLGCGQSSMPQPTGGNGSSPAKNGGGAALTYFKFATDVVRQRVPAIDEALFVQDEVVLNESQAALHIALEDMGLDSQAAYEAIPWVYIQVRSDTQSLPSDAPLSRELLVARTAGMGIVTVRTVPEAASILIDGIQYSLLTNTEVPIDPGEHQVVLAKGGYKKLTDTVTVVKGKRTPFVRTLDPE